jgi:hypothetical protein
MAPYHHLTIERIELRVPGRTTDRCRQVVPFFLSVSLHSFL